MKINNSPRFTAFTAKRCKKYAVKIIFFHRISPPFLRKFTAKPRPGQVEVPDQKLIYPDQRWQHQGGGGSCLLYCFHKGASCVPNYTAQKCSIESMKVWILGPLSGLSFSYLKKIRQKLFEVFSSVRCNNKTMLNSGTLFTLKAGLDKVCFQLLTSWSRREISQMIQLQRQKWMWHRYSGTPTQGMITQDDVQD